MNRAQWIWQMSQELKPLTSIKNTDLLLRKSRAGENSSKTSQKQRGYWCGRCIGRSVQETSNSFTPNGRKKAPEHSSCIASQGSWCSPVESLTLVSLDTNTPRVSKRLKFTRSIPVSLTCFRRHCLHKLSSTLHEEMILQWQQPYERFTFLPFTSPAEKAFPQMLGVCCRFKAGSLSRTRCSSSRRASCAHRDA